MEISAFKTLFGRPGRERMYRTDRIDLTVEDLMNQFGLYCLRIGSGECENECHFKLDTNQ
jgi:hypothetical protein